MVATNPETVAVTGGNGKIGRALLEHLCTHGYRVINVARGKRREDVSDEYRTTDLEDAGEVYGSLARSNADAVIHMGTIPSPVQTPGYVTYRNNVISSYHVLEASAALGIERLVLPSSINAMGAAYQEGLPELDYLPVDEAHRLTPRDPYGTAKHAMEVTADAFGRLDGPPRQIASLRYPWVASEEELVDAFVGSERTLDVPELRHGKPPKDLFCYVHVEDAVDAARRAIEADFDGHERLWIVAADTSMETPTPELVDEVYPDDVPVRGLAGHESLVSVEKARRILGWEPRRSWRDRESDGGR